MSRTPNWKFCRTGNIIMNLIFLDVRVCISSPPSLFLPRICHNFSTSHSGNSIRLLKGARFICVSVKNSILSTGERENFLMTAKVKNGGGQHFQIATQTKCKKMFARAHFISIEIVSNPQNIHVLTSKFPLFSTQTDARTHTHFSALVFELFCWFCLESSEKA